MELHYFCYFWILYQYFQLKIKVQFSLFDLKLKTIAAVFNGFLFASSPQKSVKIYRVEGMGLNFDNPVQRYAAQCAVKSRTVACLG